MQHGWVKVAHAYDVDNIQLDWNMSFFNCKTSEKELHVIEFSEFVDIS